MAGQFRIWMERIGVVAPALLLTIAAFAVAYRFVQPAPPRHIVMATGAPDGVYYYYGRIYHELMAREGIEVTLVQTAGSIANIDLLNQGKVDVAFIQGGTRADEGDTPLRSLASLYFEPIWLFVRKDAPVAKLADLRGQRIAVGIEGSGTRALALQLLADIGLGDTTAQIFAVGGGDAATALKEGRLDGAFLIGPANARIVRDLLVTPNVRLLPIDHPTAYRLQHRFLSLLTLPEGAIDLAADVPARDTVLLAPAANLVVRDDFHPALAELLLIEARKIHGYAGIFEEAGEFPSRKYLDYPMAEAAERFFDSGPSFLQRYLPLIALAYPFIKLIPPTYNWRMRSRIDRWYRELQAIERNLEAGATPDELRQRLLQVEAIEQKVRRLTMPVAYGNPLYSLRQHISMLRDELRSALERLA
jgi:TRAP transporter TAXI family solute receptor